MAQFDVFNGDADGLCSLQQLRLVDPVESTLVTGVKRDIALLNRVPARAGDWVTVLDIGLEANRDAAIALLDQGVRIRYFDHHFPGDVPCHPAFKSHIETRPDVGTSLLVDAYLKGRCRAWAVVGTFGDNFDRAATEAAAPLGLGADALGRLRELGIYLNYNGYGESLDDLWFPPDVLYRRLHPYEEPLAFIAEDSAFATLKGGYQSDMDRCAALIPAQEAPSHRLFRLPAEPWARRVGGVLANQLAQAAPERAHALLTAKVAGGFLVSVRAPLVRPTGADELCRRFPTGGGRRAAAGINHLPEADFDAFAQAFLAAF